LLELERGTKPEEVRKISAGMMNLFMEVSRLCRQADGILSAKALSLTVPRHPKTSQRCQFLRQQTRGNAGVDSCDQMLEQIDCT